MVLVIEDRGNTMRFRFKIQQYQTDAVESVARVFAGQPYSAGISYRRDVGEVHSISDMAVPVQMSMVRAAQRQPEPAVERYSEYHTFVHMETLMLFYKEHDGGKGGTQHTENGLFPRILGPFWYQSCTGYRYNYYICCYRRTRDCAL